MSNTVSLAVTTNERPDSSASLNDRGMGSANRHGADLALRAKYLWEPRSLPAELQIRQEMFRCGNIFWRERKWREWQRNLALTKTLSPRCVDREREQPHHDPRRQPAADEHDESNACRAKQPAHRFAQGPRFVRRSLGISRACQQSRQHGTPAGPRRNRLRPRAVNRSWGRRRLTVGKVCRSFTPRICRVGLRGPWQGT